MKIKRRISINLNQKQADFLNNFSIEVNPGLSTFYINDASIYEKVKSKLQEWNAVELFESEFTKDEMLCASSYAMIALWHNGYPQPESSYIEDTYDISDYCKICGIGLKQKEAFKLRREVEWRNKKVMHLNWVFDELFVPINIYESIFKPFGIEKKPVFTVKEKKFSSETCQLSIPFTELNLEIPPNLKFSVCSCGRKKYLPIVDSFFPKYLDSPEQHIFKTKEYFGSGHSARNQIMISKSMYNVLVDNKFKLSYTPLS